METNTFKKRLVIYTILFLLICTGFTSNINAYTNQKKIVTIFNGSTLYVGGNGPNNYSKIQYAIDNSTDGDTVFVYSGEYIDYISLSYNNVSCCVVINKSISLIGEDKNTTIINADYKADYCIGLTHSVSVFIQGFTIKHANNSGIHSLSSPSTIEITHNIITDNIWAGISIDGRNQTISSNLIRDNRYGIILWEWNNIVCHNIISKNKIAGILCYYQNNITRNEINGNGYGVLLLISSENKIYLNNISNNNIGLFLGCCSEISVIKNNFIKNNISASFTRSLRIEIKMIIINIFIPEPFHFPYKPFRKNIWDNNYWDKPLEKAKLILGNVRFNLWYSELEQFQNSTIAYPLNWVNIDWHPSTEPYNIGN